MSVSFQTPATSPISSEPPKVSILLSDLANFIGLAEIAVKAAGFARTTNDGPTVAAIGSYLHGTYHPVLVAEQEKLQAKSQAK